MGILNNTSAFRNAILGGPPVLKAQTYSAATLPAFTVAGGEVLITALWIKVTTSITTDGGTLAVNNVPTTGNTIVLVTATDLGTTTDTTAGTVVGLDAAATAAPSFLRGGRVDLMAIVTTGVVNVVGASAVNGAGTVYATWVPLTDGATLVAA